MRSDTAPAIGCRNMKISSAKKLMTDASSLAIPEVFTMYFCM